MRAENKATLLGIIRDLDEWLAIGAEDGTDKLQSFRNLSGDAFKALERMRREPACSRVEHALVTAAILARMLPALTELIQYDLKFDAEKAPREPSQLYGVISRISLLAQDVDSDLNTVFGFTDATGNGKAWKAILE